MTATPSKPSNGIGDVPGHRRPGTTFIYARLAAGDLRRVALDPAEVS